MVVPAVVEVAPPEADDVLPPASVPELLVAPPNPVVVPVVVSSPPVLPIVPVPPALVSLLAALLELAPPAVVVEAPVLLAVSALIDMPPVVPAVVPVDTAELVVPDSSLQPSEAWQATSTHALAECLPNRFKRRLLC